MTGDKAPSPGLRLAVDYAPLLVFFAVNFFAPGVPMMRLVASFSHTLAAKEQAAALILSRVICATAAFVLATIAAMVVSRVRLGRISPMLWISGVLVVVFGGLTIYFADQRFIQMKPTFVYAIFAGVLGFGLATGRPLLEQLLGAAYPGLEPAGWRKLTVNWTAFFVVLAVANEVARATLSYDGWVFFKFPGCTVATLLFAVGNVPMLMRHGLSVGDGAGVGELPPE